FIFSLFAITTARGGKDLKVGLFGVEQVLEKKSPYDNPTDPDRPLFRYAPGFTILQYPFLLQSKMISPFKFKDITPSVQAWYWAEILALLASAMILLKLIPAPSRETGIRNLKAAFLLALPFIGYELANCQNKLIALFFILLAIYLFEKDRHFLSAVSFAVAITIYIPLIFFIVYFILRRKWWYIVHFAAGCALIFLVVPYLVFGFEFNNYLLKDWFLRTLKPFFLTTSYASYIDLRVSSQSLPSAVGRLLGFGKTWQFHYLIHPVLMHIIIRIFSGLIFLFSCLAVWNQRKEISRGLGYAVFIILPLVLPQYCLYYTWSWLFVVYFAIFNYISWPEVPGDKKRFLLITAVILLLSSYSMAIRVLRWFSVLFLGTIWCWGVLVATLISEKKHKGLSEGVRVK
ncbi:MAG: glycosyltransferase family 87 protein, partial [Candidatus Omnitrophota bacterium]|nr:glycosyltransferase family 87 protein [Candidatus Omnitrophota bacterium]